MEQGRDDGVLGLGQDTQRKPPREKAFRKPCLFGRPTCPHKTQHQPQPVSNGRPANKHTHTHTPDLPAVVYVESEAGAAWFTDPVDFLVANGRKVARKP